MYVDLSLLHRTSWRGRPSFQTIMSPQTSNVLSIVKSKRGLPHSHPKHLNVEGRRMTEYLVMLDKVEEIPFKYNFAASALSWLLLAGYLVFPSTFASLQKSSILEKTGRIGHSVDHIARDVPLVVFASIFCLSATFGLLCLWCKYQENYVWIQRRIFM